MMKCNYLRTAVLWGAILVAAPACVPQHTMQHETAACADPLYQRLKGLAPDSLSEREWSRLQSLEQLCTASLAQAEPVRNRSWHGMDARMWWSMPLMVLGAATMAVMHR